MAYYLNFVYSAAGDKYFNCSIPASTSNAGRPLQIEWEIEFEAKKTVDQFIVASLSSAGAANLLFLRSGTDFEFRSETNANWIVTTGVDLTNFNVFKIRSTFDGTTRTQTLHINGNLIATRNPTTATVGAIQTIAALNSSATRGGSLKYLKYTDFVTPANNRLYDANLSNGTGTILPESISGINATQVGAWPADNSEWVFYESGGGVAWTGVIGKTNLTPVSKNLLTVLGYSSVVNKHTNNLTNKQLNLSSGFSKSFVKGGGALVNKSLTTSLGYSQTLNQSGEQLTQKILSVKAGYSSVLGNQNLLLTGKQLNISTGTAISFTELINKASYTLGYRAFEVSAGFNSNLVDGSLTIQGKQENILAGFNNTINELNLNISEKQLNIQTGTEISFIGILTKNNILINNKQLDVSAGTSIPFNSILQKTRLNLSGKQLDTTRGQILELQKQAINLVTKGLILGEPTYPIVPVERLFTLKIKDTTYLFKQKTTVYIINK